MAKLFSAPMEAVSLKSLCSSDLKISGALLSKLDESFYHTEEGGECYGRIRSHFLKKGEPPSYKMLCQDVGLSEDAREFLRSASGVAKNVAQIDQLVGSLNEYRQTRLYYKLAKRLIKHLEMPKINPDELSELCSGIISKIQLRRTAAADIIHIGKDSNVREALEEILYGEANDNCIPTGFKTFDSVNGGFFRGSLVTIGGTSGGGKCSPINTAVQLSTLEFQLEDGLTLEAEPEEKLLVRLPTGDLVFKPANQISLGEDLVTDPQTIFEQILMLLA
jgi:hypothetical protein